MLDTISEYVDPKTVITISIVLNIFLIILLFLFAKLYNRECKRAEMFSGLLVIRNDEIDKLNRDLTITQYTLMEKDNLLKSSVREKDILTNKRDKLILIVEILKSLIRKSDNNDYLVSLAKMDPLIVNSLDNQSPEAKNETISSLTDIIIGIRTTVSSENLENKEEDGLEKE